MALCSLLLVLGLALAAVAAAGSQLRCLDAAREAARLVARGEPERARQAAERMAPSGARIDIHSVGDEVTVEVSRSSPAGLPGLTVTGRAVAVIEPGAVLGTAPGGEPSGPPASTISAPPASVASGSPASAASDLEPGDAAEPP